MIYFLTLQVTMEFGLDKRAQTLQGLAFPLQEEAKRALQQLKQKRINYIQLVRKPIWLISQGAKCNKLPVKRKTSWKDWVSKQTVLQRLLMNSSKIGCAWLDPWTKPVCACVRVAEAGCRERDHWAGSHQTYRNPRASLQDSYRFTQIPLLHLQTFPPGPAAGGARSVHSLTVGVSAGMGWCRYM